MDEKLDEFRRWLMSRVNEGETRYYESDSVEAGLYEAYEDVLEEFDERFGA